MTRYNAICEECESDMQEGPVLYSEVMETTVQTYVCPVCEHEQEDILE